MKHRMVVAAIAAAALVAGACADGKDGSSVLATEPGPTSQSGGVHYFVTAVASIRDAKSGRFVTAPAPVASVSSNGSVVTTSGTGEAMQLPFSAPGVATQSGTSAMAFDDSDKHHHVLAVLYGAGGGPPAAIQHYVDGALVSTSAFTWQKTSSAWVRTSSLIQMVRGGTLFGSYKTTTAVPKSGGPPIPVRFEHPHSIDPLQRFAGRLAYGLAFAFAPQDASAQIPQWMTNCQQELLRFAGAAAVVVGVIAVIAELPALTPLVTTQFISAAAALMAAEDAMLDCYLTRGTAFGPGTISGGGGKGHTPPAACLSGSFAPQCSTPLTL